MRRLLVLAALAGGCDPGFEDVAIVLDLRVLGVRAEPPEVVLDIDPQDPTAIEIPPVAISALVADPGADRRLEWSLTACPGTEDGRCDPELPSLAIASGGAEDPESAAALDPAAGVGGELRPDLALLRAVVEADPLGSLGGPEVHVVLRVAPVGGSEAEAAYAFKRVAYVPRDPPERVANRNPTLDDLTADDASLPSGACGDPEIAPLVVAPGREVKLEPWPTEGAAESYVLPTFDGSVRTYEETLAYAWYATAGSFSAATTGGQDISEIVPTFTFWTAPDEPTATPIRFWLVQRDGRGGVAWRCFRATVEP